MAVPDELLDAIDDRIKALMPQPPIAGTVTYRDTTGAGVTCVFDGSPGTMPCKVYAGVDVVEGDRVGIIKIGSEWVVFGCFSRRGPSNDIYSTTLSAGTTTSGSMVDLPGSPEFEFIKRYDDTRVEITMAMSCFSTVGSTEVGQGVIFDSTDVFVSSFYFTSANVRHAFTGLAEASGLAAGTYTVGGRWDRESGTGTLTVGIQDWLSIRCVEIPRHYAT